MKRTSWEQQATRRKFRPTEWLSTPPNVFRKLQFKAHYCWPWSAIPLGSELLLVACCSQEVSGRSAYSVHHNLFSVGAGYIDVTAALYSADKPTAPAWSPTVAYNSATQKVELRNNAYPTSIVWGGANQRSIR